MRSLHPNVAVRFLSLRFDKVKGILDKLHGDGLWLTISMCRAVNESKLNYSKAGMNGSDNGDKLPSGGSKVEKVEDGEDGKKDG